MSEHDEPDLGNSQCPGCGGPPTDESVAEVRLNRMGYLHKDALLQCDGCDTSWTAGTPVGIGTGLADGLVCDSCGGWRRVHRVRPHEGAVDLQLKCPNHAPLDCPDCGASAEPRFTPEGAECSACGWDAARSDLSGCYDVTTLRRETAETGYVLVGWPHTTGDLEDADGGYLDTVD